MEEKTASSSLCWRRVRRIRSISCSAIRFSEITRPLISRERPCSWRLTSRVFSPEESCSAPRLISSRGRLMRRASCREKTAASRIVRREARTTRLRMVPRTVFRAVAGTDNRSAPVLSA
ncbi:hypothetical protein H206_05486 [Candidatus Electrothrix aarhusensis]|uniref:Uncharacterized protein n=1 Tax=Candidatus Electrothrix aarhusensis TaxID=1859131 RepID=A0A3S3RTX4_9BACT|nr:hypothetical protein H206_05486 [Candidatus Electrothrix aarhusensis]